MSEILNRLPDFLFSKLSGWKHSQQIGRRRLKGGGVGDEFWFGQQKCLSCESLILAFSSPYYDAKSKLAASATSSRSLAPASRSGTLETRPGLRAGAARI